MKSIWLFLLFCVLLGCEKIKWYPDLQDDFNVETQILGHRGAGAVNAVHKENSLSAAHEGLSVLDGIEVDVQISKDRTLWLSHDIMVPTCSGISQLCFPETRDSVIARVSKCSGSESLTCKLEDVFLLMRDSFAKANISIDVKAWTPCDVKSSDILGMMNLIAEQIIFLAETYNLDGRVLVESETTNTLHFIKKRTDAIECYVTSFGDFERAMQICLEGGFNGISFEYKALEEIGRNEVGLIRRKGLKIQLWTVNNEETIIEAMSINPDYIQTDNLDYFK